MNYMLQQQQGLSPKNFEVGYESLTRLVVISQMYYFPPFYLDFIAAITSSIDMSFLTATVFLYSSLEWCDLVALSASLPIFCSARGLRVVLSMEFDSFLPICFPINLL